MAGAVVPPFAAVEREAKPLVICVTGAGGYVGSHVVARLLAAGHTVHATARNPTGAGVRHLTQLPGAAERLRMFKADLTRAGDFDAAAAGCQVMIHTASPYAIDVPAGREEELMIRPAVEGTANVLASVNATPSVRRVVLTSSVAAVFTSAHERGKGHVFTEADWNLTARPKTAPYHFAKTAAEKKAYEMCEAARGAWTLVSLNPGTVWGPPLGPRPDGESITNMRDLLSGSFWPWAPPLGAAAVDIRDVAAAHCVAAVSPAASGRYLLSAASVCPLTSAARVLRRAYPGRWIPPLKADKPSLLVVGPWLGLPRPMVHDLYRKVPAVSTAKAAKDLGLVSWIPFEQSVLDMAADMIARDMVPAFVMPRVVPVLLGALLALALAAALLARLALAGAA